jgi:hypothetical protein
MLRMLIHFVGDVHQPLHATDRISISLPGGDLGGNLFPLAGDGARNLHSFWDDTAGLFPQVNPSEDWSSIADFARKVEKAVPLAELPALVPRQSMDLDAWARSNAQAWANESYLYGVDAAYSGIEPHSTPSSRYTRRAQEIVRKRLAFGGYRLAAILNTVVKSGLAGR